MRLILLFLVGCSPRSGTIEITDGNTPGTDTGVTNPEPEPEPEPEPDFSYWDGRRTITNGDCAAVLKETGDAYGEDWEYWEDSKELCPKCDYFYRLEVRPGWACDVQINTDAYRALDVGEDGTATVYYWSDQEWNYVPLAENGQIEDLTLTYSYEWPWGEEDLLFEGRIYFEEL